MRRLVVLALAAPLLQACGSSHRGATASASVGTAAALECVPYARQASGIQLYGDAASWWDQARGRYDRSADPVAGGVLVFRRTGRLPSGHVSVVSRVTSGREIVVSQANWVHHRITRDEPIRDVSPGNDWSQVRVWWAPSGSLGSTVYSTYGFIVPNSRPRRDLVAALSPAP